MKTKVILISCLVVTSLTGLRLYGGFQNERINALHRADLAEQQASIEQEEADRLQRQMDRASASCKVYHEGCVELLSGNLTLPFKIYDHASAANNLNFYSRMEKRYSQDYLVQSMALVSKTWRSLAGIESSQEDWVNFLKAHDKEALQNAAIEKLIEEQSKK